jgi:hypothetical protein
MTEGRVGAEAAQPGGHSLPPPTLAQVIASIHESRDEQTELLCLLVTNFNREGTAAANARDQTRSSYVEFLAIQPSLRHVSRWRPTIGFAPSSPSLSSSTVQRFKRCCLQPISY